MSLISKAADAQKKEDCSAPMGFDLLEDVTDLIDAFERGVVESTASRYKIMEGSLQLVVSLLRIH